MPRGQLSKFSVNSRQGIPDRPECFGTFSGRPMHIGFYTLARLMLYGFGWGVAALLGYASEQMLTGTKWPVFGLLSAWWTFACSLYVQREAVANSDDLKNRIDAN